MTNFFLLLKTKYIIEFFICLHLMYNSVNQFLQKLRIRAIILSFDHLNDYFFQCFYIYLPSGKEKLKRKQFRYKLGQYSYGPV